jgi:hypothetical protein
MAALVAISPAPFAVEDDLIRCLTDKATRLPERARPGDIFRGLCRQSDLYFFKIGVCSWHTADASMP